MPGEEKERKRVLHRDCDNCGHNRAREEEVSCGKRTMACTRCGNYFSEDTYDD